MLCRFTRDPSARRLTEESGLRPAAAAARAEDRGADQAVPPLTATTAVLPLPARPLPGRPSPLLAGLCALVPSRPGVGLPALPGPGAAQAQCGSPAWGGRKFALLLPGGGAGRWRRRERLSSGCGGPEAAMERWEARGRAAGGRRCRRGVLGDRGPPRV